MDRRGDCSWPKGGEVGNEAVSYAGPPAPTPGGPAQGASRVLPSALINFSLYRASRPRFRRSLRPAGSQLAATTAHGSGARFREQQSQREIRPVLSLMPAARRGRERSHVLHRRRNFGFGQTFLG